MNKIAVALLVAFSASIALAEDLEPRRLSEEKARTLAVYAPKPPYPYEARKLGMTGVGAVIVSVDPSTGVVTAAQMERSMGHKLLDDAALTTFQGWRFRLGTVSKVRIPIRFTLGRFHVYVRPLGDTSWLQNVTYWFLPDYPREAVVRGVIGSGVAILKIDPRTGSVKSASMLKSTGQEILDGAAVQAFRQWRFKSGTLTTLEIPIEFASWVPSNN
jgi:TonB family protein